METDFTMTGSGQPGLICGSVSHQGRQVRLEAESRCGRSWRLRIIGNKGRISEWCDPFDSVAAAIVEGLAVLQSDIDEFCDGVESGSGATARAERLFDAAFYSSWKDARVDCSDGH